VVSYELKRILNKAEMTNFFLSLRPGDAKEMIKQKVQDSGLTID
jgi:hypothetical protein